jgi:hypothetical protein
MLPRDQRGDPISLDYAQRGMPNRAGSGPAPCDSRRARRRRAGADAHGCRRSSMTAGATRGRTKQVVVDESPKTPRRPTIRSGSSIWQPSRDSRSLRRSPAIRLAVPRRHSGYSPIRLPAFLLTVATNQPESARRDDALQRACGGSGATEYAVPEHRDLASGTMYVRDTCLSQLRAKCRALRESMTLEREWKVSPTIYLVDATRVAVVAPDPRKECQPNQGLDQRTDQCATRSCPAAIRSWDTSQADRMTRASV